MKLMKQKKGGKIALSFASPEKEKYYYFIYDVITWDFFSKESRIYYLSRMALFIYQCHRFHPLTQSHQEFASDFLISAFSRATDTSPVPPPPHTHLPPLRPWRQRIFLRRR
jgi:hypothetical protein